MNRAIAVFGGRRMKNAILCKPTAKFRTWNLLGRGFLDWLLTLMAVPKAKVVVARCVDRSGQCAESASSFSRPPSTETATVPFQS